jgi:hypothetical protein
MGRHPESSVAKVDDVVLCGKDLVACLRERSSGHYSKVSTTNHGQTLGWMFHRAALTCLPHFCRKAF